MDTSRKMRRSQRQAANRLDVPGYHATVLHRVALLVPYREAKMRLLARMVAGFSRFLTGIKEFDIQAIERF